MTRIPVGKDARGETVLAAPIEYKPVQESWNTYSLEDGTTIRMKTIVTSVLRTDLKDANGVPVYVVRSQNVIDVRPGSKKKVPR